MLTPMEMIVISAINKGTKSGVELRKILKDNKITVIGPGFYQLMKRMEKKKIFKKEYKLSEKKEYAMEAHYTINANGKKELEKTLEFYKKWIDYAVNQ